MKLAVRLLLAVTGLGGLGLLPSCPIPGPIFGPPITNPGPPPQPLPPLDPDPLAASGPGNAAVRLTVQAPVLSLRRSPESGSPQEYCRLASLSVPLGLYPGDAQRPVRQRYINAGNWAADAALGRYTCDTAFTALPLGGYSARVAWWNYTSVEWYEELLRGPQLSLSEGEPAAAGQIEYPLLAEGSGEISGRILLPRISLNGQLTISCNPDHSGGPEMLSYSIPANTVPPGDRLFFRLTGLPDGYYEAQVSGSVGTGPVRLAGGLSDGPSEQVLNAGSLPEFQLWPRRSQDNMFFGFVQVRGRDAWHGDIRIAALLAGSSEHTEPLAWIWLAPSAPGAPAISDSAPWYTYYEDAYPDWPPPGTGYGLSPLAEGSYDIYAELFSPDGAQPQRVLLAADERIPPADSTRLFRDEHSNGAPWWVALPLELDLSGDQT